MRNIFVGLVVLGFVAGCASTSEPRQESSDRETNIEGLNVMDENEIDDEETLHKVLEIADSVIEESQTMSNEEKSRRLKWSQYHRGDAQ